MNDNQEDNVIRNPERKDTVEYVPYTPQYRSLSIDPQKRDYNNNTSTLGMNAPNVGNNEDQLWTNIESNNKKIVKDDNYVIILRDKIFFVGNLNAVEKEVKSIFYGEHHLCKDEGITIDDVIVLKKMKIKIGIFVE